MSKTEIINEAIELLRQVVPPGQRLDIDNIYVFDPDAKAQPKPVVYFFDCKTYEEGTQILRSLGIQKRNKDPQTTGNTNLRGETPMFQATAFCATLPKTCCIVETKKLVPKREVRTIESNEMVEVIIKEVVCTGGNDAAKLEDATV